MKQKAFVTILEMIVVIAMLIVAYGVFFPGFSYQNRWGDAFISLKGRDLTLTLDRTGDLYRFSFDDNSLRAFLDKAVPTKSTNLVHWSGTSGTVKPVVTIACDCTEEQKNALISWIGKIRVNNRDVDLDVVSTGLDPIYSASDVLLIWGNKDLTNFERNLKNYLKSGNGIIEIMGLKGDLDVVQEGIFGIDKCGNLFGAPSCGIGGEKEDSFMKPDKVTDTIYTSHKYFHHMPMPVRTITTTPIPIEPSLDPCTSLDTYMGVFRIRGKDFGFWTCGGESAYFDTGGSPSVDIKLIPGDTFSLDGQNLLLSYIDGNVKIGIAFLEGYKFKDFLEGGVKLYPKDRDKSKVLLSKGNYANSDNPTPVVILNGTSSNVAWISDFTKDLGKVDDDQKLLLASLLLSASDKRHVSGLGNLRLGHLTSYVNVVNQDMYEIYRFDLGLGFPF